MATQEELAADLFGTVMNMDVALTRVYTRSVSMYTRQFIYAEGTLATHSFQEL